MEELTQMPEKLSVVDIQFRPGQKIYFFDPDGMEFAVGDHVIIDTARGAEFGYVAGAVHQISQNEAVAPLRKVLRKANAQDERQAAENRAKEKRAFEVCAQKIADHGLDMQLVSAECAFDGSKLLFYFTADERVDFRELVKNLASVFHTRIELRQIGVRDKAKMVGGLGICGRPFCCASFLDDFQPVSIKMAKTQGLSLNPAKISGTCGRLMCCLKYEQDAYEDLIRRCPKADSFVDTPEGRGTVTDIDLLRQRVKVRMEEQPEETGYFPVSEIYVLRNGKAKKNDPPIPADLAPISGSGKRVRKLEPEDKLTLDPIKFRYSTEEVVETPEAAEEAPEEKSRRSRRRKGKQERRQEGEAPAQEQPKEQKEPKEQKPPKAPKPKKEKPEKQEPKAPIIPKPEPKAQQEAPAEKPEGEAKRRPHRRRHYRKPKNQE